MARHGRVHSIPLYQRISLAGPERCQEIADSFAEHIEDGSYPEGVTPDIWESVIKALDAEVEQSKVARDALLEREEEEAIRLVTKLKNALNSCSDRPERFGSSSDSKSEADQKAVVFARYFLEASGVDHRNKLKINDNNAQVPVNGRVFSKEGINVVGSLSKDKGYLLAVTAIGDCFVYRRQPRIKMSGGEVVVLEDEYTWYQV